MSREPFDAPTVSGIGTAQNVSGNASGTGRHRRHVSAAARVAAFRAANARLDVVTTHRIAQTIASLATDLDCSRNDVVNSLLRFALTNRNWRQQGLWGSSPREPQQ